MLNRIIIIDVERRGDLRARISAQLETAAAPPPVELLAAADGTTLDDDTLAREGYARFEGWRDPSSDNPFYNRELTADEIGRAISHHRVWQRIADQKIGRTLVLEDHAELNDDFFEILGRRLPSLDAEMPRWHLLYTGRNKLHGTEAPLADGLVIPRFSYCSFAYVVTLAGANRLLASDYHRALIPVGELLPALYGTHPRRDVDRRFGQTNKLRAFAVHPPIASGANDSDAHNAPATTAPAPHRDRASVALGTSALEKLRSRRSLTPDEINLLNSVIYGAEDRFLAEIRGRQARIDGLDTGEFGHLGVWGGEFTPGCQNCINHRFNAIRSVNSCNLSCDFCYYRGLDGAAPFLPDGMFGVGDRILATNDIKLMISKAAAGPNPPRGIAWVWFEPFVSADKHSELVAFIHGKGIHQHLYTNGTLCTKENLRQLANAGLDEIRFNLAASGCADQVIDMMHIARELFDYVCIESPLQREFFERFMEKRDAILATGVDHIHSAELHLTMNTAPSYVDEDYNLYQYRKGYVSPLFSRRLTYDLIDVAVAEGWKNVVIHDCSNQVKLMRGLSSVQFGQVSYDREMELPLEWFEKEFAAQR